MQTEFNVPAPWRFCRQQILAFVLLNLLGSCVHTSPSPHASQPHVSAVAQQLSAKPSQ
ncbi:hypothetical protein [Rheinheimera sp. F8]|uniref:hypothetical protein n=1 Tax=Rheinheimera sp. F8 TaxID=1763998 RepID=UPI000A878385|nr:hypothetical protein [Rheinheimera sp. F8]